MLGVFSFHNLETAGIENGEPKAFTDLWAWSNS